MHCCIWCVLLLRYWTVTNYSQQDATFLEFIYFYRHCACFRRFLRPSSGAHNRTYSFRYCQPILLLAATVEKMELSSENSFLRTELPWRRWNSVLRNEFSELSSIFSTVAASSSIGWQYLKLYVRLCVPDDGRRSRLKHVEPL